MPFLRGSDNRLVCVDGGMPSIFWATGEILTSAVSICLPAMLNLGRRFSSVFLHPLTSKLSIRTGTGTQGSSKSNGTGREANPKHNLDYQPSLTSGSTASQSMLVLNATNLSVGPHKYLN